eukprot:TRINITY_DN3380_c3_g1_i1.p1 TRINITY_DN3380_c3_g1~~TRINITY_DN3380_c3_g1_i1.p1  ORF type:complete len:353 (-),score=93.30 TRINITY_DN3380_c3_g1_i1:265-1323(-)
MLSSSPTRLTDKINRFWEELEQANPDAISSNFTSTEAFNGNAAASKFRTELKRLKFVYTQAEAQRRFVECTQDRRSAEEPPVSQGPGGTMDMKRKEAKERNRSIKQRLEREYNLHNQLMHDITEANKEAQQLYEQCKFELTESDLNHRGEDCDADLDLRLGADAAAAELGQANAEARRGATEARRFWTSTEQVASLKRKLQWEISKSESRRRQDQTRADAFKNQEARERRQAEKIEELLQAEAQLGLPRIHFDRSRGVVQLGEAAAPGEMSDETDALRTVQIEFGDDGKLLRAEPHRSLGLERSAAKAVDDEDLPGLLTLAWTRLCEGWEDLGGEDLEGVRRISGRMQRGGA